VNAHNFAFNSHDCIMVRLRLKLLHEKNEMETYTFYYSIPFDREYDGGEERGADLTESDAEV
jgi:hypothetical protein